MSSIVTLSRPRRLIGVLASGEITEREVERRVQIAWSLLVLNVLTFQAGGSILHIPSFAGKAIPLALIVMLSINRRLIIRPNVFLCLMSLLAIEAILTATTAQYLRGTTYR